MIMEAAFAGLLTSIVEIISKLVITKALSALGTKLQQIKDSPQELENLETDHILAIRNSICKLDALHQFDGDDRRVVKERIDQQTLLCYEIQDLFVDIGRKPSRMKKRKSYIDKLTKALDNVSSQLNRLEETRLRKRNGFHCQGQGLPEETLRLIVDAGGPCQVKPMDTNANNQTENCKQLIVDTALSLDATLHLPALSLTADKLAERCGGFSEVARMLGVALASHDEGDWKNIITTDLWDLPGFKQVFPTLRPRYLDMEPHLKQCLAYFSLFPCHYQHFGDELIQLWAAEGFISSTKVDSVKELLQRMILELSRESIHNGDERPIYMLQKFSHEVSKLAAASTFLHFEPPKEGKGASSSSTPVDKTSYTHVRHLSFSYEKIDSKIWKKFRKSRLRTFIALSPTTILLPHDIVKTLKRLRVLSLKQTNVEKLPNSIDELQNLQYLDISGTPITELPKKLSKISTLQFLRIKETTNLLHLPQDFQNLSNLVCIDWEESDIRRFDLPSHIGNLRHLQTLPLFPVQEEEGCSIAELKNMDFIQGSICIINLENVETKVDAGAANLRSKEGIDELQLEWTEQIDHDVNQEILSGLEPHDLLKKLTITNGVFPSWLCNPERMLEVIHMKNCRSNNALPALGDLTVLKTLTFEGVSDLQQMNTNFRGNSSPTTEEQFKSLSSLTLKGLSELEEWTGLGPTDMPNLRELKIIDCPQLMSIPSLRALTSLVDLQIECCQKLSLPDVPTSLTSLIIKDSPLLNDRSDWEFFCKNRKVIIDGYIL